MTLLVAKFKTKQEANVAASFIRNMKRRVKLVSGKDWDDFYFAELIDEGMRKRRSAHGAYSQKVVAMMIVVKRSFERDVERIKNKELRIALNEKLSQIDRAKDISHVTGVKLLRGYSHHYRIIVKTEELSYRIGGIIRGETIWLARFLPRKIVYRKFP